MSLHQRPLAWLTLSALLTLMAAPGVHAQSSETSPAATAPATPTEADPVETPAVPVGDQSRKWLRSQAAREQASPTRQTQSGPVMKAVHERYVRSFTAPTEPTSFHNRDVISSN